jgi:hypothetical protein
MPHDFARQIRELKAQIGEDRKRLEALEAEFGRGSPSDPDDLDLDVGDPASEPSGRGYVHPGRFQDRDPYARGAEPHGGRQLGSLGRNPRDTIPEYRKYRRDTTPARVASGYGAAPGAIFGADVARYALASKHTAGMRPDDIARATVSRYRRHRDD